ncbi:1,3-beta-galactosyl-N-acetylhexosamine phosphorylase [Clostridium sardiniense]|uniref:1,3-beta-galactosyl-N-acetylhexosamine phosphorylase n=1 Tax=Clostridium sardiniense TaxID=29369 RepID=A0ABS7KZ81_CLOSR|nr:1,3-beta-galactosyl-N-acetylhexosamine phosphorylase [Clostridium sardiniense]MBY0756118.1 1,3-beta-galactosyl-N-acetylhexosamine phosphorylase [Clostridium sardiniense]MDQ0458939.1 1,3-beta-galactosyl-N-acetylhexosamine phosphorylase [Clostridium sardiniense]
MIKGKVTIPTDKNMNDYIKDIIEKWGADAIRDCDGTKLGEEITGLGVKNYSTYLTTRNDQDFIRENMDEVQQLYLMSEPVVATSNNIKIDLLKGYFKEQFDIDKVHDEKLWWEVIDRTTGEVLDNNKWTFDRENGKVLIEEAVMWHKYTVNFLVYMIWDPTQMYNHITNDWGDKPHEVPYDCRQPKSQKHMLELLEKWLDENPEIDVVRFTTFFHHFTLCFNEIGKEKFVDWFGYSSSVSPKAMEDFEKDKGYKLRSEDIVDEGYYNSPFRVPTKEYKDYIDFQSKWVASLAKKMVDMCHEKGKEAMMFLGDNWIGTEPYGKYFENIGLDAVVGSVGNGATMRMISDIPGVKYTEGRFLPYFFPDVFTEGGDPVKEGQENWLQARRAILRKPLERIGYGGYLGLTKEFPEFVDEVEKICNEFREIHETIKGTKSYTSLKVGVLNSWGKLRTWQTNQVAHALWYREIYSYVGVIECLSGMPVDVEFISFDDIKERGISDDIKVIINAGDAYTAWSGGDNWMDEKLVSKIREWVYNGGGFIGVGDPTACQYQGRYFQLDDVMGVDKEIGFSLSTRKYNDINDKHFLLEDIDEELDFGEGMDGVYAKGDNYQILSKDREYSNLVVNTFGKGRSVYFAGLPYTPQNCRLLLRAVYFVAGREDEMKKYYVTNVNTECAAFEELGKVVVINNTRYIQNTDLIIGGEIKEQLKLNPMEMRWIEYK